MPTWLQVIVQSLLAIAVLFLITRFLGKRQLSQLSFFEYTIGIAIGNLAGGTSLDTEGHWYVGLIALVSWGLLAVLIQFLQIKSKKARDLLDSRSTMLIRNGKILEDNLKKEKLSNEELLTLLRSKDVFDLEQVEYAVVEPNGEVNVLLKKEYQPLTPSDYQLNVNKNSMSYEVILDGKIMHDSLRATGFSTRWLNRKLDEQGIKPENVFLAQLNSDGKLYVDEYNDNIN